MADIIGRDDENLDLDPFALPSGIRWGFPAGPLRVGYMCESMSDHASALGEQMKALEGCHKIFHDRMIVESGEVSPRIRLREMFHFLREGDTVVIYNLSSLGTSAMEIIGCVIQLLRVFRCHLNIPGCIDTTDPDIFVTVLMMCDGLARN